MIFLLCTDMLLPISKVENLPVQQFRRFLQNHQFPCLAAKAAQARQQINCLVAGHLACPNDDEKILNFLYLFVDEYRSAEKNYHSAAIIFTQPNSFTEEMFDAMMWHRLQTLADFDAKKYNYDARVSSNTADSNFSFSLKEEAFYIIGLHPFSSRQARRFQYPTLVFNPHQQFEDLRKSEKYEPVKNAIRKRDIKFSGSVNPMLQDFGNASEVYQYSGKKYDHQWQCPLNIHHAKNNTTP